MTWVAVLLGGAVGAPLRYVLDRSLMRRRTRPFPWGTLVVNLLACLILGFITEAAALTAVPAALDAFVGPGLCGALSTYSTFSFETVRLAETDARGAALASIGLSLVLGLGLAYVGAGLAALVWG